MPRPKAELWIDWTTRRDERAFESLVRPEMPHALGFARRLGCSAADADDALQDALVRLAVTRDDSPRLLGVRAWLCREVHVRARSRLRSERRRRTRECTVGARASAAVSVDAPVALREEVDAALAGLDEDERRAVELRYLHDLDYREIAAVVGASEGACRLRVHKAIGRLRARFGGGAGALVAALPLPAARDASALVKAAIAKSAATSVSTGGLVVMATTQKVAAAAVVAALFGVAGTLAVQQTMAPPAPAAAADSGAPTLRDAPSISRRDVRSSEEERTREADGLRARIGELERSLAEAQAKADDFDALDPMAVIVYSNRPVAWKARKLLEIPDESQRWSAFGKVGAVLAEKDTSGREFLEALRTETDPKVIEMLGTLARVSLSKTPAEDRRAFLDLLRSASLPATRAAAAQAIFMSEQFRGGFDDRTKALAKELNDILIEALRTESAPEVAGAIARSLDGWTPPPEAVDALRSAADRLPPSPGRRMVWETLGRGMGMSELFREFDAATAQDVKDDIAAGIARRANSGGAAHRGSDAERQQTDARTRFLSTFGATSHAGVRHSLVRGSFYGLGCIDLRPGDDLQAANVRFLRGVAALEPDATQRGRIEKLATAFETKGPAAVTDVDRILSGKE